MKKELEGWLWVCYEDTSINPVPPDHKDFGHPKYNTLIGELEEFSSKKVKITIEEVGNPNG